jgi:amidase
MGQENVESCLGPMCSNLAGCVAFTRGVLGTEPWKTDAGVVPLPWKEEDYLLTKLGGHDGAILCIGVYDFDGEVHVHPPFKRAIKSMVEALKLAGHEGM